jgi:hypothetical protein
MTYPEILLNDDSITTLNQFLEIPNILNCQLYLDLKGDQSIVNNYYLI